MQMQRGACHPLRHGKQRGRSEGQTRRIDIPGAGVQARRPRQVDKPGVYQRHHQRRYAGGVVVDSARHADEIGVHACGERHRHLAARQAIASHGPLEELDRHPLRLLIRAQCCAVDHAGRPLPQLLPQRQCMPGDLGRGCRLAESALLLVAKGVACIGQPGEARQTEQPLGKCLQPVGGDAQQLQTLAVGKACRQLAQPVAREHQLLQGGTLPQLVRQPFDGVVGQDQPAQPRRQ